eukprot:15335805-Heterocapsa_arctica.AAC.1
MEYHVKHTSLRVEKSKTKALSVSDGATSIKWGAQENHDDLLLPLREEVRMKKTFRETVYDKVKEDKNKCNWEAKYESNYISRRSKNEVER